MSVEPLLKTESPNHSPNHHKQSIRQEEKDIVLKLPDISDRIHQLGLTEEYHAFRDRYMAWRQGDAKGARGEIVVADLTKTENVAANRGFGYYFPTVQEWLWKRTMSYWIAVTFFEGAIFFTISSFMFNQKEWLGDLFGPMTMGGYLAGKALFIICCYLMCLETVNFNVDHTKADDAMAVLEDANPSKMTDAEFDLLKAHSDIFYYWPYRYKTALLRLEAAGAGPLPYYISIGYLTGVLSFTVGMVMELVSGIPEEIAGPVKLWSFVVGAFLFWFGGVLEVIMNGSFTTIYYDSAKTGATLNFLGGAFFLAGSIFAFSNGAMCNTLFGWGSFIYCISSSVQVSMWKNEQFGLTFLAVLNNINRSDVSFKGHESAEQDRFSVRGAVFVHLCCACGAVATYNFNIEVTQYLHGFGLRSLQLAFNEFLPCLFAHLMLMLTSAVMRAPKTAPFRQLYFTLRFLCVALLFNSGYTLITFLQHRIQA